MNKDISRKDLNKVEPQFYVRMVLSSFEAAALRAMRSHKWGTLEIIIQNGQPRKCVYSDSMIFDETDGALANVEGKILEAKLKHPIIDESPKKGG